MSSSPQHFPSSYLMILQKPKKGVKDTLLFMYPSITSSSDSSTIGSSSSSSISIADTARVKQILDARKGLFITISAAFPEFFTSTTASSSSKKQTNQHEIRNVIFDGSSDSSGSSAVAALRRISDDVLMILVIQTTSASSQIIRSYLDQYLDDIISIMEFLYRSSGAAQSAADAFIFAAVAAQASSQQQQTSPLVTLCRHLFLSVTQSSQQQQQQQALYLDTIHRCVPSMLCSREATPALRLSVEKHRVLDDIITQHLISNGYIGGLVDFSDLMVRGTCMFTSPLGASVGMMATSQQQQQQQQQQSSSGQQLFLAHVHMLNSATVKSIFRFLSYHGLSGTPSASPEMIIVKDVYLPLGTAAEETVNPFGLVTSSASSSTAVSNTTNSLIVVGHGTDILCAIVARNGDMLSSGVADTGIESQQFSIIQDMKSCLREIRAAGILSSSSSNSSSSSLDMYPALADPLQSLSASGASASTPVTPVGSLLQVAVAAVTGGSSSSSPSGVGGAGSLSTPVSPGVIASYGGTTSILGDTTTPKLYNYVLYNHVKGTLVFPPQQSYTSTHLKSIEHQFIRYIPHIREMLQSMQDDAAEDGGDEDTEPIEYQMHISDCESIPGQSLSYWIGGRVWQLPTPQECYVCYQEDTPVSCVELAYKLNY